MAHRSFVKPKDPAEVEDAPEAITFDLADTTDLLCRERVNGKLLMDLIAMVDSNSVGLQSKGITKIFDITLVPDDGENPDEYLGKVLTSEEYRLAQAVGETRKNGFDPTSSMGRFQEVIDDPATPVEMEELAEIVGWLVEQYTGRPTENAKPSANGSTSTNRSSPAARRLPAGGRAKAQRVSSSTSSTDSSSSS